MQAAYLTNLADEKCSHSRSCASSKRVTHLETCIKNLSHHRSTDFVLERDWVEKAHAEYKRASSLGSDGLHYVEVNKNCIWTYLNGWIIHMLECFDTSWMTLQYFLVNSKATILATLTSAVNNGIEWWNTMQKHKGSRLRIEFKYKFEYNVLYLASSHKTLPPFAQHPELNRSALLPLCSDPWPSYCLLQSAISTLTFSARLTLWDVCKVTPLHNQTDQIFRYNASLKLSITTW